MNEVLKLNLPEEIVIKILNGGGGDGASVTVDSELSMKGTNPVQSKAVYQALVGKSAVLPDFCVIKKSLVKTDYGTNNYGVILSNGERMDNIVSMDTLDAVSSKKQNKKDVFVSGGDTTVGLFNNQEVRVSMPCDYFSIALIPDENGLYDSYESYAVFSADTFEVFFETDLPCVIKFIGDDCDSNYKFTPQPNTFYEVGFKYVGEIVTEVNLGIPTYKHVFVARVGAF